MHNYTGGDAKSSGLYQQQIGPGFSWHGGTNREEATREYVAAAMTIHAKYPTLPPGEIAWRVQNPAAAVPRPLRPAREGSADVAGGVRQVGAERCRRPDSAARRLAARRSAVQLQGPAATRPRRARRARATSSRAARPTPAGTPSSGSRDDVHWRAYTSGRVVMFAPDTFLAARPATRRLRRAAPRPRGHQGPAAGRLDRLRLRHRQDRDDGHHHARGEPDPGRARPRLGGARCRASAPPPARSW